jgi:hypothetical protein
MNDLIAEIRAASDAGLHYLALFGALVLVDICGALASENGRATPSKFRDWLRANVPDQANNASEIYGLRCSLLHQGRAMPHGGHFPIAFTYGTGTQIHNVSVEGFSGDEVGLLSIPIFVDEVTRGAEAWLAQYGETTTVKRNLEKFARFRPNGLPPHLVGPLIA